MNEKISIIVPIYNSEKYLEKCLDSIICQTYRNLEIILINDGSTDSSPDICERYGKADERIIVIHKENGGNTSARKAGLAVATGEYVGFVDSDDWIEPVMYETLYRYFSDYNLDIISCGFFCEKEDEAEDATEEDADFLDEGLHIIDNHDVFMQSVMEGNPKRSENICSFLWSKLVRRELIRRAQNRIYDKIVFIEDRALLYTCYYDVRRLYILKTPLYHYRIRKNSLTHMVDDYMISKINDVYIYQKELFSEHSASPELHRLNERFLITHLIGALRNNMGFEGTFVNFILPWEARGKRIIIYGAGSVGKQYYSQLESFYCTGWWTDKRWKELDDPRVIAPEEALSKEYDLVIIAVLRQEMAKEIMTELKGMGIEDSKIIWRVQLGGELIYV